MNLDHLNFKILEILINIILIQCIRLYLIHCIIQQQEQKKRDNSLIMIKLRNPTNTISISFKLD